MKHRFARMLGLGVCIAIISSVPSVAAATPNSIEAKKAQAEELQRAIDANGERVSMLAERYDIAQYQLDETTRKIDQIEKSLSAAQAETDRLGGLLANRAASMYVRAGGQSMLDAFDVGTVTELASRAKYAELAASQDNELIDRVRIARSDLRAREETLTKTQKQAKKDVSAIAASKREVEAANDKQRALLGQVNGEIATLIKQEQARKAAEEKARSDAMLARLRAAAAAQAQAAAAARATTTSGSSNPSSRTSAVSAGIDPGNVPMPTVPAPSSGAAAAVAYAQAQLGKPYVYAATGPNAFDCSGLTMMAWAQGGVSMPHYSAAQGHMFPRVPSSAMQPGDLVIYYADEHHVAIYVGGGMTIAATHTGDFVRLQPVFRDGFQYAVRPG